MGYALVRIKPGAMCMQDVHFFPWPGDCHDKDRVFIGEKRPENGRTTWLCRAFGAGLMVDEYGEGAYGNGLVYTRGDVEILSPLQLTMPCLPGTTSERGEG